MLLDPVRVHPVRCVRRLHPVRVARPVRRPDPAEWLVLIRSRRRVAAQVAVAMTMLISLVGAIAFLVLQHGQHDQMLRELDYAAAHGDSGQQVGCTYVFVLHDGRLSTAPSPPAGLPVLTELRAVATGGRSSHGQLHRDGTVFTVRTLRRGDEVVQVAFDGRYQRENRYQLAIGLLLAEGVGLLVALGTGIAVGHRTIAPLAEALTRQRQFVTDASHELRTPIAQVHTRAQLLARQARSGSLPADHQAELGRLITTTRQLGEIVEDLLLSSRLATVTPQTRTVDLAALATAAVAAESDRAKAREITLALHRPTGPLLVAGIESALRRVLTSLLDNSIGHTPPGGRITVTLRHDPVRHAVELAITDTGVGFDAADSERLFDRFHRGSNGSGRRFGLGLALVREVVLSHHGSIEANGSLGQGATFTLRLPTPTSPQNPS